MGAAIQVITKRKWRIMAERPPQEEKFVADGFGVKKIWLCGITGRPGQPRLDKVSLGAEHSVPWEHAAHTWSYGYVLCSSQAFNHFFLQPMDGLAQAENTGACIAACMERPAWRLSLQTHKLTGIR